jgi:hypothetical protein
VAPADAAMVSSKTEILGGDRVVLDERDTQRLCEFVERSGPQQLEAIAVFSDQGERRLLVSCPTRARARACAGTVRVGVGRAVRFAVESGRRARIRVYPRRAAHRYQVRVSLRSGRTLRVALDAVERP